ncbi:MAG: tRNA pseudouridine(38-40) synthase TruA [Ignavibacteriae bacterium HGW-Ignavibacteriae-3]|nr:MAG: tRNA pseudouridine(38-40) synthase TruA [Ignavibacteriae bacterium HGW-Ignavibacteriae-3]
MARFKLFIEYEGTRYSGWQMQRNAKSVQGKLMDAASKIFKGERADIQGSGRTDAGVHALCQVAHLDVKTMLAPEIIRMKFNDELPADISVLEVEKTDPKFHARHDAKSRSYLYQISKRRAAFGKPFVWWIKDKLSFEKMERASKMFVGMHDYVSFADRDDLEKSTKVLIEDVQLKEEGDLILIRITGSHFLWKMVRRMVGVLVEVGRDKMTDSDIKYFLEHESPTPAKFTAPPSGLFLESVLYGKETRGDDFTSMIKIDSRIKSSTDSFSKKAKR